MSLALLGACLGIGMVPILPALSSRVAKLGCTDWGATFSLFNLCFTIGALAGPVLATVLVDEIGYCNACVGLGASLTVAAAMARWVCTEQNEAE